MIRKAKESDIDSILHVLSHYNLKVINAVDGSPLDDDYGDTITLYNQVSQINLQNAFVALSDGKIVGFSHYKHLEGDTAKTTLITVMPEYERLGFGKQLQLARMKEAHEKGYKKLITYCENPLIVNWYVRHFNYQILRTEPVCHRLHFFKLKNRIIWAVHYGSKERKTLQVLLCDLEDFFKKTRGASNGKTV
jgi:N-acetylglutamate synthase-like GNAT family acetyltransferase